MIVAYYYKAYNYRTKEVYNTLWLPNFNCALALYALMDHVAFDTICILKTKTS